MPQLLFYIFIAIIGLFIDYQSNRRMYGLTSSSPLDFDVEKFISGFSKRRNRRISALKTAQNYLKPYEQIFGTLVLSNKQCSVTIDSKGKCIKCLGKVFNRNGRKMTLVANNFSPIDIDEYFDMICEMFNYNTHYEDVYNSLRSVAVIKDYCYQTQDVLPVINEKSIKENECDVIDIKTRENIIDLPEKLTDVNNCSEAELTALPGISIIIAKKIVNYREQQRPFKSVEDFIDVMNIKPHFARQLKNMICANKVNMKRVKKAKAERIIDL